MFTWQSQLFCSTKVGQRTSSESLAHCEIVGAVGYGAAARRRKAAAAKCHEGHNGLAAVEPAILRRLRRLRLFLCDDSKHRGLNNLSGVGGRFNKIHRCSFNKKQIFLFSSQNSNNIFMPQLLFC